MLNDQVLHDAIAQACATHGVPSASVAVIKDGTVVARAAAGTVDVDTGRSTRVEQFYEIRSVSKLYTAVLLVHLFEQRGLSLGDRVADVLSQGGGDFGGAFAQITWRQLLSHSSGLDADLLADVGNDAGAVGRLVLQSLDMPLVAEPGAFYSYSNVGIDWAGWAVELLTGQTWEVALHEQILAPLGLEHTFLFPHEAPDSADIAKGHIIGSDDRLQKVSRPGTPRSIGPAGGLCATALDVARFGTALYHTAARPSPILSPEAVADMQGAHAFTPNPGHSTLAQGLGLGIYPAGSALMYGINGGGLDHGACLRVVPSHDLSFAITTNGGRADRLFDDIFKLILAHFGLVEGTVELPRSPNRFTPLPAVRRPGRYVREGATFLVEERDGVLQISKELGGSLATILHQPDDQSSPLQSTGQDGAYTAPLGRFGSPVSMIFIEHDGQDYLHFSGRAARRAPDDATPARKSA